MTDYPSATSIRDSIIKGECTALDIAAEAFRRIEKHDPAVRAFISHTQKTALDKAAEVDTKISRGKKVGALAGVPVVIKDNINMRGTKTTCASRILENYDSPYDAFVVKRLLAEDAVIVGKANMDEFAMGSSCENSAFHPTHNPWNPGYIPGGSSGGSAAAVAARMTPLSLGSDTGGSIRQPAALCGVVGIKATYGRVSRYGLVAFGSSLDQIGPIATNVRDCALLLNVIAGADPNDSTSADVPVPDFTEGIDGGAKGMKLGVPREYFVDDIAPEITKAVKGALDVYKDCGAELVDISLPHTPYANPAYHIVADAEASSNLARYDGIHYGHRSEEAENLIDLYSRSRTEGFGPEVKRRILLGTYVLSAGYYDAYYLRALKVRTLIRRDFDQAFKRVDAIVCPITPVPPFKLGERIDDPLQMYYCDILTTPANLAGLPALSLPCGFTGDGMPIGMQLMGRPFDEATLLRVARAFEAATDFNRAPALS
ncbi:MAG: Asp-tRNA(Asn)/Glu-tRNA(Gln) amidotransferase GatCAB subunit A [Planctomycetota bacterium]|nr:MAG: Asp-tRNA(Asn)/Glu-tRNA(Gln) amidotransferase GatCAB subunit A [Planctomycetota bacterium]